MTELSFEIVQSDLDYWKLMTSLAFQTEALESLMPVLKEKQEAAVKVMAGWFEEMGSEQPMEETLFYGAVMDGIMLHYMQMEEYPVEQMKTYVLNHFFNKL